MVVLGALILFSLAAAIFVGFLTATVMAIASAIKGIPRSIQYSDICKAGKFVRTKVKKIFSKQYIRIE